MTPARRFSLDVAQASVAFLAAGALAVLLVEGLEQARWAEQLDGASWARFVLARWPGRVASVVPVLVAAAAAAVAARWQARGDLASLEAAGVRPLRLAAAGALAALLVGGIALVAHEGAARLAEPRTAASGAWVRADDATYVRADLLVGDLAVGVAGATVTDGRVTAFGAARATHDGAWRVHGARGLPDVAIGAALPAPEAWRARARGLGPDAAPSRAWGQRDADVGRAWLGELGARVLAGAGFAGLAAPLARRGRAVGLVGAAIAWRVVQTAVLAAAAAGAWPAAAMGAWLALVVGATALAARRR